MTTTAYTIRSIRYAVPSRTGGESHVVSVDVVDARTRCTCRAGSFGRDCHAQAAVRERRAGKPIVRVSQRRTFQSARISEAGREIAAMLDC